MPQIMHGALSLCGPMLTLAGTGPESKSGVTGAALAVLANAVPANRTAISIVFCIVYSLNAEENAAKVSVMPPYKAMACMRNSSNGGIINNLGRKGIQPYQPALSRPAGRNLGN